MKKLFFLILTFILSSFFSIHHARSATYDLVDLWSALRSNPEACEYNVCRVSIGYWGDENYSRLANNEPFTLLLCNDRDDLLTYRHSQTGMVLPAANLKVDLNSGICTIQPVGDQGFVPIIKNNVLKEVDGCEVTVTNQTFSYTNVVSRSGVVYETSDTARYSTQRMSSDMAARVLAILVAENRCPKNSDPGFELFPSGFATPVPYTNYCCCSQTGNSLGDCLDVIGFSKTTCRSTLDQYHPVKKDYPADGQCSVYESSAVIATRPGVSNVSIPLTAIQEQAKGLNMLGITNVNQLIERGINLLMAFMGTIMFALYVYAGFLWMTAAGNEEKISSAKSILVWSTLGVAVMMSSYVIVKFIFESLKVI